MTLELYENELESLVTELLKTQAPIILLRGDLSSGKTTLVKAFAKALEIDEAVTSPTFSVMNQYADVLYHYDIYHDGLQGFLQKGLLENLELEGYHLIEWGGEEMGKMLHDYGFSYRVVTIEKKNNKRVYKVTDA
jgi:tRNA threonylcarbamoyladenosine biosynthesis protein TsaE